MIRSLGLGLCLILLLAGNAAAQAACDTGSDRSKVDVAPDPVVFPNPTGMDFFVGWVMSGTVTVRVNPRGRTKSWTLCLASDDLNMGGYGKPVSDLEWQVEGAGGWTPVDLANQVVLQGAGRSSVSLRFRALLFADRDAPGSYDAVLRFTAKGT